jgi:hypothetical protein
LPIDVLEGLARDHSADVRFQLTGTDQPESVKRILRQDPDPLVAQNIQQWPGGERDCDPGV